VRELIVPFSLRAGPASRRGTPSPADPS